MCGTNEKHNDKQLRKKKAWEREIIELHQITIPEKEWKLLEYLNYKSLAKF